MKRPRLPEGTAAGFVTGATIANFTAQQNAVPKGPVGGAEPAGGLVDLYDPNARP